MTTWGNAIITDKGLALQAKLTQGTVLSLLRAVSGSGYVDPDTLHEQTSVTNEVQELSFGTQTYPEERKCAIPVKLTNEDLATGYNVKQIGIYAFDPDEGEILFLIAQAEDGVGTTVPSEAEMPSGYAAMWTFYIQYGRADGVSVTVDPANTVSYQEMEQYVINAVGSLRTELNQATAPKNHASSDTTYGVSTTTKYGHAKASTTTPKEPGTASVGTETSSFARGDHVHPEQMASHGIKTGGTGDAYTATVPGITSLENGTSFIMVPHISHTTGEATLNVNNRGASLIARLNHGQSVTSDIGELLQANRAVRMVYYSGYWVIENHPKVAAEDLSGRVPVATGGTPKVTTSDNGKFLRVVNGQWAAVTINSAEGASF